MKHKFEIGDAVIAVGDDPEKRWLVIDHEFLSTDVGYIYICEEIDGNRRIFLEKDLELVTEIAKEQYSIQICDAENVMIVNLYENVGTERRLVAKSHGHVIHEGLLGYVQAVSYAMTKLYRRVQNGGDKR